MYGYLDRLACYFDPFASRFIEPFAADLLCRIHRRRLVDLSLKIQQDLCDVADGQRLGAWDLGLGTYVFGLRTYVFGLGTWDLGLGVPGPLPGVRFNPKSYHRLVFFRVLVDKLRQPRGLPDQNNQYASRKWIERTRVANSFRFQDPAHAGDNVMGGDAGGFIDDENAIH